MMQRFGGRYELVKEIGAGGMGRVFESYDLETGRIVATKVMIATGELELQALLRFQQEGAVLATLSHPNIVTVYGTFLEEHACAIVMERLQGRSLQTLLQRERPSLVQSKQIALQVLSALEYAHARGIVHRDVKPDNIMVLDDGRVKVTDFGIARVLQSSNSLNTATGTTLGTPLYMSPELIEGIKADGRSDLYSLGVVLYHMVTGRPPFEGDEPLTIAFKHVHKAPQPPRDLNEALPSAWDAVILKALAKNPADRFQTAAAMREAVELLPTDASAEATSPLPIAPRAPVVEEHVAHGEAPKSDVEEVAASAGPPAPPPESPTPVPAAAASGSRTRRGWIALGGVAALLVLAVALAAFFLGGSGGSSASKPVALTVVAPSGTSLPAFQIRNASETQGRKVKPSGSTAKLSLSPGHYVMTVPGSETYLDPVGIEVGSADHQTVHLDALYGKLTLRPPAGRVAVPGFELEDARTGKSRHGVDGVQGEQGIYVRPGRYRIAPWPSEYVTEVPVTIRPHHQTTLNLASQYGHLTVVPLARAPSSGFDLLDSQTHQARSGMSAARGRLGAFVPVGRYDMHLYYSDVYPDSVPVAITAGGQARIDLNTLLATIRTPAMAKDYSVTYTWREGGTPQTLQAGKKARTYYIRAGTYPLQVEAGGSTRVTTLRATLGKVTTLPKR